MNNMHWILCLLSLAAVVISALILVKVDKKSQSKDGYKLLVHQKNLKPRLMSKVTADNPDTISDLAKAHCPANLVSMGISSYNTLMKVEDSCEPEVGSLWDDDLDRKGLETSDDMVMSYICDESIQLQNKDGTLVNTSMKALAKQYYPWQSKFIECALKNPDDPSQCCDTNQEPVWRN